jgi:hypothetical protein
MKQALSTPLPWSSHDKVLLQQLIAHELPDMLRELADWMARHGKKGEQDGYL